jgi:hypothetical protein
LVERFLVKHAKHEGVRSALAWLQTWLDAATLGEDVAGGREMQRLAAHGVPPLSILTESAALFLLSRWNPRRLPDDDRLTFAIGIRVLTLAPREKRFGSLKGKPRYFCRSIGKASRRDVGRRIRLNLAPLLVNIAEAIGAERDQHQQFLAAISSPFQPNPE